MNKLFLTTTLSLSLSTLSLFSQEAPAPGAPAPQASTNSIAGLGYLKDYSPIHKYDPKFKVEEISYSVRLADTGKGEFLDVNIRLKSRVPETNEYAIYVLALNEGDSTIPMERALNGYPPWRKSDPEKETPKTHFSQLSPANIPREEIWGEELFKKKEAYMYKVHNQAYDYEIGEPSFYEYMLYLTQNPSKALKFNMYGDNGPAKDKFFQTNYVGQTEDEKKRQVHETLSKHTYSMYFNKYETVIVTHHYNQFRPKFMPFNKIGILIFDTKKAKDSLVFRKIQTIDKIKMNY